MTDTVAPDTMKGGYVAGPGGERLGPPARPDGNMVVALTPDWMPPGSVPLPHITPPSESGREISDAAFTLTETPPLVAIRYRPMAGDPHVAVGWLTAESDFYYRLDSDLMLHHRDTKVGATAPPSIGVNFITKSTIITMFEIIADGAGQLLACWGNPKIVRKRP